MIGVPRGSSSLLTVGIYGLVKLVATVIYVTLIVDRVGRRLPLMIGATIQACAMLYIGLFIRFASPEAGGGTSAGGYVGIIWSVTTTFRTIDSEMNADQEQDLSLRCRMVFWSLCGSVRCCC